jgi:hypothetical protein
MSKTSVKRARQAERYAKTYKRLAENRARMASAAQRALNCEIAQKESAMKLAAAILNQLGFDGITLDADVLLDADPEKVYLKMLDDGSAIVRVFKQKRSLGNHEQKGSAR